MEKENNHEQEKESTIEKNNFTANVAGFFLHNKTVSIMFLVSLIVVGYVSFLSSPKAKDPEMEIPKFQVVFDYSNATADEVERFVTAEVESLVTDLPDVKKIDSVSVDGGKAIITVEFETFVNIETAKISLLSKFNEKEDLIRRAGLSSPVIKNLDSNSMAIVEIGFTSDNLNQNQVRTLAVDIMNELKKVPGASTLNVYGGDQRSLRIILDPGRMRVLGVSATSVINAIQASNIKVPSGLVRQGDSLEEVEVNGTFLEKDMAERILIKPGVQIKDVAKIEDYYPEKTSSAEIWRDGETQEAVFIGIAKVAGQDATKVAMAVETALEEEMKKEKYADIHHALFRNDGEKATEAVTDLAHEVVIALASILLVLIYFLNVRTAVVVASALPLAILIAFAFGYAGGVVISEVALFGLIIALGILVDSATVVVEGSYDYIQHGMDKKKAFLKTLNESGVSILIANIATIIVFVPLTLITGTVGVFFFPAVFFIIVSLFGSLIVAFSMVPFLGSILLKKEKEEEKVGIVEKIRDKYVHALEKILRSKAKMITFSLVVLGFIIFACMLPVIGLVKQKSIAGGNTYKYTVFVNGPDGMDVARTKEITDEIINKTILTKTHVESVQSFVAEPMIADLLSSARGSDSRNAPNVSTIKVNLDEVMPGGAFATYISELRASFFADESIRKIIDEENVKIKVYMDPMTPVSDAILLRVGGPQDEIRQKVADDMVSLLENINGAIHIDSSREDAFPKIVYRVDHDKALASGVTAVDVSNALKSAIGPNVVSQFHAKDVNESASIELQFARENRDQISDLSKIFLTNVSGQSVPLDSVVEKIETRNEPKRLRHDKTSVINVTAEVEKVPSADVVRQVNETLEKTYVFPDGGKFVSSTKKGATFILPNEEVYTIMWGGETENTNDANADLGVAMVIAFIAITLIFIVRFNSVTRALIVISSVPLSLIGIFIAFSVLYPTLGIYFTSMSVIGIIALMGIVVNNSILIISHYDIVRARGFAPIEALLDSGGKRFRPILLTSSAAILGNVIMLFDATWNSLAWAIISGVAVSATLVLFMVPILHTLFIKEENEGEISKKEEAAV